MAPELRIPIAEAPTDTIDVTDLESGPDTSVYALEPAQRRVVNWDQFGKLRRAFGQDQLQAPTTLGWHNGMLWVWEPTLRQISRFKPDGTFIDRAPLLQSSTLPKDAQLEAMLSDTTMLVSVVAGKTGERVRRALLRVNSSGAVLDTIALLYDQHAELIVRAGNATLTTTQPFGERAHFAYSARDGMIVFVQPDTAGKHVVYVNKVNQVGDTLFSKELPYDPVRFDAVLVAPVVGRVLQASKRLWTGAAPTPDEQTRLLRDALYTPRTLPTVSALLVAVDGTIVLRREEEVEQVNWSVVEGAEGKMVARQRGPARANALMAGGPFVYAAEHEPGSIPEVVRYRLLNY